MVQTQVTHERLLKAGDVSVMLSLSKRQVHRLNSSGQIPEPVRVGGSVRWPESELSAWIQAGTPNRKTWDSIKEKNNGSD